MISFSLPDLFGLAWYPRDCSEVHICMHTYIYMYEHGINWAETVTKILILPTCSEYAQQWVIMLREGGKKDSSKIVMHT